MVRKRGQGPGSCGHRRAPAGAGRGRGGFRKGVGIGQGHRAPRGARCLAGHWPRCIWRRGHGPARHSPGRVVPAAAKTGLSRLCPLGQGPGQQPSSRVRGGFLSARPEGLGSLPHSNVGVHLHTHGRVGGPSPYTQQRGSLSAEPCPLGTGRWPRGSRSWEPCHGKSQSGQTEKSSRHPSRRARKPANHSWSLTDGTLGGRLRGKVQPWRWWWRGAGRGGRAPRKPTHAGPGTRVSRCSSSPHRVLRAASVQCGDSRVLPDTLTAATASGVCSPRTHRARGPGQGSGGHGSEAWGAPLSGDPEQGHRASRDFAEAHPSALAAPCAAATAVATGRGTGGRPAEAPRARGSGCSWAFQGVVAVPSWNRPWLRCHVYVVTVKS